MKGITFGEYHSYRDFKLLLLPKEMGAPEVKKYELDIEGADGSLDLTDFFGEPKYHNVRHKFDFSTIVPQGEFLSLFSTIKNAIHGKKMRVILDDDPLFYYVGRLSVSSFTNEKNVGKVSVEADCEPYKYKLAKTVVSRAVNGEDSIVLTNSRKRAVPEVTIETESSIHIVFQSVNIWDLGSGSFTLPELELTEGENEVSVSGVGNITFTWQEASL